MKVLVTGGVRSGKSRHAESLLQGIATVTYVAPGPTPDAEGDPDWSARIAAHQAARPSHWTTLETADLVTALDREEAVIVDCLGTWLTRLLDDAELWEATSDAATARVNAEVDRIEEVLDQRDAPTVFVTNEVGLGVIPSHRSGRLFRDLLGLVNQRVAARCDAVHLVIAGRVLEL